MFYKARLRLTLLYSFIFLLLFWTLSAGAYMWMNGHFGDGQRQDFDRYNLLQQSASGSRLVQESPSDRIMDEFRNTLIGLDILLLILVPALTWLLTGKTLAPVQEAQERERHFFTDASHDLRTPLTILKGEIELALKHEYSSEMYKKTLRSNQEEINGLIALVESMLFFARGDNLSQIWPQSSVDLTDIVAERVAAFQSEAQLKKISLSLNLPDTTVLIHGNPQLLQRVLTSLIDNALKYTPEHGNVTLTLINKAKPAVIIADTGIGIPQADRQRIFDRFYRGETSRQTKGYGLGLSIAKKVMDTHHGKISIVSNQGQGTTVTLTFPTARQSQGKSQT